MANHDQNWWQNAIIYQIYPRSLKDSNGDGIGDIPGIIQKLDYIASLGVDAIWISPFFKSPMKDFGYDVSDYRDIDPIFGVMNDFDELIEQAHRRHLKVLIDHVLSHTSDQHTWFKQSREHPNSAKEDWYVWVDAKEDGAPPNNWLSIFGGSAWQWEPRRRQYYLHNFLASQPDLNFHNLQVQQAVLDNMEFWLKKGVDGFRLDAVNFCFHDQQLRDNPAKPLSARVGQGFQEDNPYAFQYHYYNNTRPENLEFLEKIRILLNQYPGSIGLGEIASENSLQTIAEYTKGNNRLHMGYSFELLSDEYSAKYIEKTFTRLEQELEGSYPCWALSNHDCQRVVTRWGKEAKTTIEQQELAKMLNMLLVSLRGSLCIYQGEELGLVEAEVPYELLQDPYGINFWPNFKGRDGCRTPIPWDLQAMNVGFSQAPSTWLPISEEHLPYAVSEQERDELSVLNSFRQTLAWRKEQHAILQGSITGMTEAEPILSFSRQTEKQKLGFYFNLSNHNYELSVKSTTKVLTGFGAKSAEIKGQTAYFSSYSVLVVVE